MCLEIKPHYKRTSVWVVVGFMYYACIVPLHALWNAKIGLLVGNGIHSLVGFFD